PGKANDPERPGDRGKMLPRGTHDRRYQERGAEVDDRGRAEGANRCVRAADPDVSDQRHDHELKTDQSGTRRPDDDVEAFPTGDRREFRIEHCREIELLPRSAGCDATHAQSRRVSCPERDTCLANSFSMILCPTRW